MTKSVRPTTTVSPCCGLLPIPDETRCGAWYVQCDHCGRVRSGPTLPEAVSAWNKKGASDGSH